MLMITAGHEKSLRTDAKYLQIRNCRSPLPVAVSQLILSDLGAYVLVLSINRLLS
jgi:hypothetical protein